MSQVRYVIVVHGMGEPRKNETVLSVVSRFAEARRQLSEKESSDVLTLGMACGQTGKERRAGLCHHPLELAPFSPWLEFAGIPLEPPPDGQALDPFVGDPDDSGDNLRFADCAWSDLTAEDFPAVGQPPEVWADGVLGRLRQRDKQAESGGGQRVPRWAFSVLRLLRDTLVLFHRLLAYRTKWLDETIFVKYLGDVQLYGEYSHIRGRAVRRFHRLLWRIDRKHREAELERAEADPGYEPREARYTIIAHSLGTVMAMDALLYAHARLGTRLHGRVRGQKERRKVENLPFGGFGFTERRPHRVIRDVKRLRLLRRKEERTGCSEAEKAEIEKLEELVGELDTGWIARVDSLVTLGSPIDKFLTIWWNNYAYLNRVDWISRRASSIRRDHKIVLFNYCDEQDPVGHRLDQARTKPALKAVFASAAGEDLVYNRYLVPGWAHTRYWKDLDLFKRILHRAVDHVGDPRKRDAGPEFPIFDPSLYQRIAGITYRYIPWALVLAQLFAFTWAWFAGSWHVRILALLLFLSLLGLSWRLIDLTLWWRQLLRQKSDSDPDAPFGDQRRRVRNRVRRWMRWQPPALWLAAALFSGLYLEVWWGQGLPRVQAFLMLLVATAAVLAWTKIRGWVLQSGGGAGAVSDDREDEEGTWRLQLRLLAYLGLAVAAGWYAMHRFDVAGQLRQALEALSGQIAHLAGRAWEPSGDAREPMSRYLARLREHYAPFLTLTVAAFFSLAFALFNYQKLRFQHIKRRLEREELALTRIATSHAAGMAASGLKGLVTVGRLAAPDQVKRLVPKERLKNWIEKLQDRSRRP